MTLPMLKSIVKGYTDHQFDLQYLAILSGYYSGYYMGAKHPKSPMFLFRKMLDAKQIKDKPKHTQEVDMDAAIFKFQEREERLRRFLDAKRESEY